MGVVAKNVKLVDLMHGGITLESELGQGTKTTFWIPFHKAHTKANNVPLLNLKDGSMRPTRGGLDGRLYVRQVGMPTPCSSAGGIADSLIGPPQKEGRI